MPNIKKKGGGGGGKERKTGTKEIKIKPTSRKEEKAHSIKSFPKPTDI